MPQPNATGAAMIDVVDVDGKSIRQGSVDASLAADTAPQVPIQSLPSVPQKRGASRPCGSSRKRSCAKRLLVDFDVRLPGRCRVGHLLTLLSVGHTKLYEGIKAGRIAKPDGNDGRPYWDNATGAGDGASAGHATGDRCQRTGPYAAVPASVRYLVRESATVRLNEWSSRALPWSGP